jgi:peptidoglycan/xylan/chitin deacetylase (PgdA/CDA1 family)
MRSFCLLCVSVTLIGPAAAFAQQRTVAVTVDDLPYAGANLTFADGSDAEKVNHDLLAVFRRRRVPVTGFVIQKSVETLGSTGTNILREWIRQGFALGNHSWSHPDINELSIEQIEDEIVRGESTSGALMRQAGKTLTFFRFPMNHTGDTKAKHDALAAFLTQRGYRLATCTIDSSDYLFNNAYLRMLAAGDEVSARKLRLEYVAYTSTEIDYYAALNKQVFGYEPPEVMLLHDNRLNAEVIDQLLELFEAKQYRFVSLDMAQADAAYRTPDTYITKYGPMWEYRWAGTRSIKVNGSLETEPPAWILDYGKSSTKSDEVPRLN